MNIETNFDESKQYLLDHMGSTYIIAPDEAFPLMDKNDAIELKKEFLKKQNDFYAKFWSEKIIPKMEKKSFIEFIELFKVTLGETFNDELEKYIEQLNN